MGQDIQKSAPKAEAKARTGNSQAAYSTAGRVDAANVADVDIVDVFAANLRRYRKENLKMTQEEFAAFCGFDRTYISGLERRTRNPTIRSLQKLSGFLGVEPWELIVPVPASEE